MRITPAPSLEDRAEDILRSAGGYQIPVPITLVANSLGLRVSPANLSDDISGMLVIEDGRGSVGYNANHALVRQRFTIAHELGHFVLHRGSHDVFIDKKKHTAMFRRDHVSAAGVDPLEIEANQFAATLLMPKNLVLREISDLDFDLADEDTLSLLAHRFEVSTQAMSIRLSALGIFEGTCDHS